MSWKKHKFKDFLKRSKIPILIENDKEYRRVTIKIKHNGVSLRDTEKGIKIGTKKQFILKKGQFILSKIDARYGAFGIAPKEVDNAIITGNFWAYDVDFKIVNIDWFNQFINSQDFYDFCERASSGITHRKYLNEDTFLNSVIYLPEIGEQQIIIDEFKENKRFLTEQSTQLTHQLDLVKQLRQSFLREAMQGKLVEQNPNDEPATKLLAKIKAEKEQLNKEKKIKKQKPLPPITKEEIPFEIPENWVWCKIGEISNSIVPNRDKPKSFTGEIPWITQTNFSEKSFNLDYTVNNIGLSKEEVQKYNCRIMPKGSIVMSCVGRFDLVCSVDKDIVANQQLHCFIPIIAQMPKFLIYSIKLLNTAIAETAIHTTIKYLNKTKLESIPIPLPPLSEQKRIVAKLDELMAYCDSLEESIKNSQQQNEMLLGQVLREALEPKEITIKEEVL